MYVCMYVCIYIHTHKTFLPDFLVRGGWVSISRQFPQIFRQITQGTAGTLCLWRIFAQGNCLEKLVFQAVFI